MNKKEELQLTEGSKYKIFSIGGRENAMESEGIFKGYTQFGIDEGGLILELDENHGSMHGKLRLIPLHAILAIDILNEKPEENKTEDKETAHYYG
jgi:hypothetical protein